MAIKVLKLVNGDEVIGDVEWNEDHTEATVSKPGKMVMWLTEDQKMGLGMSIWVPYSDQTDFPIKAEHIITEIEPAADIRNDYSSKLGSGLVVPETPSGIVS